MKRDQYRMDISGIDLNQLGLSVCPEEVEKLRTSKPNTIFAASRIPGIRPTTLIYLHQLARKMNLARGGSNTGSKEKDLTQDL